MGFGIFVADDPQLSDDAPEVLAGSAESNYPHFSVNRAGMGVLKNEMAAQGFAIAEAFGLNQGEAVTSDEIDAALEFARDDPVTIRGHEDTELWREWLAFLRLASREHGGVIVW